MAFRYINPGIADLFDEISDYAVQGYDAALRYSRTSGDYFGFRSTGSSRSYLALEPGAEYWVAFNFYLNSTVPRLDDYIVSIYNAASNLGISLRRQGNTGKLLIRRGNDGAEVVGEVADHLNVGQSYHFEIHVKSGAAGWVTVWLNGERKLDCAAVAGNEGPYNKLYVGGGMSDNCYFFSDIAIQNTGRIGDMRINRLRTQKDTLTSDWDRCAVPVGILPVVTTDFIGTVRTILFPQYTFAAPGKITAVWVSTGYSPTVLTFFLFRKNTISGKYTSTEVRAEYTVPTPAIAKISFAEPMIVQTGDILGVFHKYGRIYDVGDALKQCCTTPDDLSTATEADMPEAYAYTPCICAMFTPDDTAAGVRMLHDLQAKDWRLAELAEFTTEQADRVISFASDVGDMPVGRIDALSVAAAARYEGESGAKSICAVVRQGDASVEGAAQPLTTARRQHYVTLPQNPLTDAPWTQADLGTMRIGVKSKP